MANLFKYVENFFNENKNTPGNTNQIPIQRNIILNNNKNVYNKRSSSISNNMNIANNNIINNEGYVKDTNNQINSNAEYYNRKRKEIKENLSEESQIKIFGENPNFILDLKVFGRSIFQNLILTATANAKSNYNSNINTNLNKYNSNDNSNATSDYNLVIIPIKCVWKRFKNETEISISNINTNSYIPTAEDIGYTILVEATPIDKNLYGDIPLFAEYGPIEMDLNIKNTLELLLTSGGTKFSCFIYDNIEQEKKTDKEIILHINSNEMRLCEVDYNGKEKELEKTKLHHFNPQIFLNTKDTQRFLLRFLKFETGNERNINKISKEENGAENNIDYTKLHQELKKEYDLIAMSKQCRELIYLLIQIFLIDEKIKNSKLFACANYNLLPQETKIGVTDLITEIKTLREENVVLINNMKYYENLNVNLRKEMKDLEEEFQISLESINNSMRINSINDINNHDRNKNNQISSIEKNNNSNNICSNCSNSKKTSSYNIPLYNNKGNKIETSNKTNLRGSNYNVMENGNYLDIKIKYDELKEVNLNLVSKEKALREENKDLLLKIEISKNSLNEISNENKKLKNDLNQCNSDLQSVNKNSQILLEQKNKMQIKCEQLQKEKDELFIRNSELESKLNKNQKEENLVVKNQNDINEKKIEELNKKNETLNYEIKNLIIQRNLLTNQKDNLMKEFEKIKNEKAKNVDNQNNLIQEIENLKDIIKEKEKVLITLINEVENSKKCYKDMKEKYELLEIEHISLKENFDKNFLNFNNNNNNNPFNNQTEFRNAGNNLMENYDENRQFFNDSLRYSNMPSEMNYDNRLHKITIEEFEEFEMLKREKEESDALIMQLKSNSEAKDLEIGSLKKYIDTIRVKK